jgi:hypothetical protein
MFRAASCSRTSTVSFVIKIDALPVDGWKGWINAFRSEEQPEGERHNAGSPDPGDDDIPF